MEKTSPCLRLLCKPSDYLRNFRKYSKFVSPIMTLKFLANLGLLINLVFLQW